MKQYGNKTLQFIADKHCKTLKQATYLMDRSNDIMPIMSFQYGNDFDMIALKMHEYVELIIKELKQEQAPIRERLMSQSS